MPDHLHDRRCDRASPELVIPNGTMCIVFTCGEHTFRKDVEGYQGLVCRCYNCGNYSGSVIKSNPWFTFCFIVSHVVFDSDAPCLSWSRPLPLPNCWEGV